MYTPIVGGNWVGCQGAAASVDSWTPINWEKGVGSDGETFPPDVSKKRLLRVRIGNKARIKLLHNLLVRLLLNLKIGSLGVVGILNEHGRSWRLREHSLSKGCL